MVKLLIILVFLCNTVSAQVYYVVPTMVNPALKSDSINRKIYRLSRPAGTDVTKYLFGYIKHPSNDSVAIVFDTAYNLRKGNITATHITEWLNELYPTLTTAQRTSLTNYVNNNTVLRITNLILTARIKLWTVQEMTSRGWFNYPPIH